MKLKPEQVDLAFKLDERGDVVLLHGTNRIVLGPKDIVREELSRFLDEINYPESAALEAEQD
jgi:hypothetical protein